MRRLLLLTCAIVLVDTVFYAALVPLIPYYSEEFGLSKSAVGFLSGAFGAGVLAGSVPGGYLAFRAGVKPTALGGLAIFSATSLAFGFAGGPYALILARFGEGFGSALSWVAAFTWLAYRAPEERRGEFVGTMLSAAVVGALLGPALGSAAVAAGVPLAFTAMAAAGAGILVWAALEPAPQPETGHTFSEMFRGLFRIRFAGSLWLITISPLIFSSLTVLIPLDLSGFGWSAAAVGAVFLIASAAEAAAHPLLGRWSDRSGYRGPVYTGLLGSILILLALPWAGSPWLISPLVVLAAAAFNASLTPGTALFSKDAAKVGVDQALVFGAVNFTWALGSAAGSPLAGFLADLQSDALTYLFLALVCLATLALLLRFKIL